MKFEFLSLLCVFISSACLFQIDTIAGYPIDNIIRVDAASRAENPDGKAWDTAFSDIQMALNAAAKISGPQRKMLVALREGRYPIEKTIMLVKADKSAMTYIEILGGFSDADEEPKKDPSLTVIDGQKKVAVLKAFYERMSSPHITLKNFSIANGLPPDLYNDPYSGFSVKNTDNSLIIDSIIFDGNGAKLDDGYTYFLGGGLDLNKSDAIVLNCLFKNNAGAMAPAISLKDSNPVIKDCVFKNNHSSARSPENIIWISGKDQDQVKAQIENPANRNIYPRHPEAIKAGY